MKSEETSDLTTPACRDCRHCRPFSSGMFHWLFGYSNEQYMLATCVSPKYKRPAPAKNMITGELIEHPAHMFCSVLRMKGYSNSCGESGDWFESKEAK